MKQYKITVNGKTYDVTVEESGEAASAVTAAPAQVAEKKAESAPVQKPSADGEAVKAPIPGTVLNWKVKQGDAVKAGDSLCVLEAMKMENDIAAPHDGVVAEICANKGASVNTGDPLLILK